LSVETGTKRKKRIVSSDVKEDLEQESGQNASAHHNTAPSSAQLTASSSQPNAGSATNDKTASSTGAASIVVTLGIMTPGTAETSSKAINRRTANDCANVSGKVFSCSVPGCKDDITEAWTIEKL
jgi:hypothetical protein